MPKDDDATANTVQKSKLSEEIDCLKEEYIKLKYKFIKTRKSSQIPPKSNFKPACWSYCAKPFEKKNINHPF